MSEPMKPDGWVQFIDGVQTQNIARNEDELATVKMITDISNPSGVKEYRPFYFGAPADQRRAIVLATLEAAYETAKIHYRVDCKTIKGIDPDQILKVMK